MKRIIKQNKQQVTLKNTLQWYFKLMVVWVVWKHKEFISYNPSCNSATKQVLCTAALPYLARLGKVLYALKQEREESTVTGLWNGVKMSEGVDLENNWQAINEHVLKNVILRQLHFS